MSGRQSQKHDGVSAGLTYGAFGPQFQAPDCGTSIFDPVLCEVCYRWFCPEGGHIFDPFAGGSVRGIVAGFLGYRYTGIELRPKQVEANKVQAESIAKVNPDLIMPRWVIGDSSKMRDHLEPADSGFDMIFTCPPYFDLEVYSDDPRDGSTMHEYNEFIEWLTAIVKASVGRLAENRFAAVVIGEVRGKDGAYVNLVGDVTRAFIDAGMAYHNEAILITPACTLPLRVTSQFPRGRKLGKCHQNVLFFWKGDVRKIGDVLGPVPLPEAIDSKIQSGDVA